MDPQFIDKLLLRRMARSDQQLAEMDSKDPKVKRMQDRRKRQLIEWREQHRGK
jgi:hypothetical protein